MSATPTGTGATPTGHTVADAASAIEALLTPGGDNQAGDDEQPGAEAQAEAEGEERGEQPGAEQEAEAGAEDSGAEEEQEAGEEQAEGESEEQTEGDEEQEGAPAPEQKFTVRVDGKDEEVPLSELLAGYSRTSDYTRKTQSLANDRKLFTAEVESVRAERAEYGRLLPKLRAALEAGMGPEPDWAKLKAEDPQKYLLARAEWDERKQKVEGLKAQERATAERAKKDQEAQAEKVAAEEHNKLLEKLPAWRDPKVAEKESNLIVAALEAAGFPPGLEIFDHRAILIARKAALYDQMVAQRGKVREKVKQVPVVKPGAATKRNPATERLNADRGRLKKTGRVDDAASLIERFL